jgi:hypothetical protein
MSSNTPMYKSLHPQGLYGTKNFVAPAQAADYDSEVTALAVRPSPITSDQVTGIAGDILAVYRAQQQQVMEMPGGDVQQRTESASGGLRLADANELAEQRKTSRMYLLTYGGIDALGTAGVVALAYFSGWLGGWQSVAMWLVAASMIFGLMVWHRHGQEMQYSRNGIARYGLELSHDLAEYSARGGLAVSEAIAEGHHADAYAKRRAADAEVERAQASRDATRAQLAAQQAPAPYPAKPKRRVAFADSFDWEAEARDEGGPQAGQDTGQDAYVEYRTVRPAAVPERQFAVVWTDAQPGEVAAATSAAPVVPADGAVLALADWLREFYATPGACNADGLVKVRVPWSARADTPENYKERMLALIGMRPRLFVAGEGGRWRVRLEVAKSADEAIEWLQQQAERL